MSWLKLFALLSLASFCGAIGSEQATTFESYPAVALSNAKLELPLMTQGGTLAGIVLKDDPEKLNPFWNPMRMARELGQPPHYDGGAGLFVCVGGFGPVSAEEKAAGLPMHGEAHRQIFVADSKQEGATASVTLRAKLPIVQEAFTRTFQVHDGENVVLVESELENELGFDRPVNWAEHATIGSPFLESGATVVDLSGSQSRTRPYDEVLSSRTSRRLTSGQTSPGPLPQVCTGKPSTCDRHPTMQVISTTQRRSWTRTAGWSGRLR